MEPFEILCGIIALILTFYLLVYFHMSTFDFWKSRGIRGPQPIPVFGNLKDVIFAKIFVGDCLKKIYDNYKEISFIGIYQGMTPILIVKDPDLIKDILIKDFSVFCHRGLNTYDKAEPLSQNLLNLEPKRWRPLRTKLSPVFTSGKLKGMFSLMSECADNFVECIEKVANRNKPIECRELTDKYTIDVIGNCVFGIEMNALADEDSEFRRMGRKIFDMSTMEIFRQGFKEFFPRFYNILGNILPQQEITKFFTRIVVKTMEYREMNNINKNDFIDALLELKKHLDKLDNIDLTDSLIASQAFIFFGAGFESSSTAITHALYELALNQKIQNKLREEIDEVYIIIKKKYYISFPKHGKDLSYHNVKEMNYLDKVLKETLRKYPILTHLTRQSTSSYTFNGTRVNIPKDQKIWIPIHAIHRDAEIYPEPDIFDPERFNKEAVQSRHPMVYLPFGAGPRNCIGSRFALHQIKIGLIKLLQNHKVETCEKTLVSYVSNPKTFVLCPKDGLYLRIIKINHD